MGGIGNPVRLAESRSETPEFTPGLVATLIGAQKGQQFSTEELR
jgi:hypothetical protein